jgi:hypothetical protein
MPRARMYVDHETCACVFANTHTRHVCLRIRHHSHVSCACQRVRCVRAA